MPFVQNYAKDLIVKELKTKIGTEFGIGKLYFQPFNSVKLDSIYLYDQSNEKILMADKLTVDINILSLISKKIVVTSLQLSDFEIHLSKETSESPLNIQYIVDAFKSKSDTTQSKIQVKLNAVSIHNGNFYYDVKDKERTQGFFDANHIGVSNFDAKLALKSLQSDSLNIQVKKMSLKEQRGLEISNLTCRLITQQGKASLKGFKLELPSSSIQLAKCEVDLSKVTSSANFLDKAIFDCIISPSSISPKDIASFSPNLQYFSDLVRFKLHASGSVNNIILSGLTLNYGERMHLLSHIEIHDIREADAMYILGSVDDLSITTKELEGLINNFSKNRNFKLPKELTRLGNISFQGDVSGYLKQLTAFGSLETNLGIIKTEMLLNLNPPKGMESSLKAKIYTSNFHLGTLLDNKDFNQASLDLTVNLQKPIGGKIRGSAEGSIYDLYYKNYTYKNINLNANYDGLRVDGHVDIKDPNVMLDIDGLFDLTDKKKPELDFVARVENMQLDELHIAENLKKSHLSFLVTANFKGENIDNAVGYIAIDSLDFIREDKRFQLNRFLVEASGSSNERALTIQSDIARGEVVGAYSFTTIAKSILHTLHPYLPALIQDANAAFSQKSQSVDKQHDTIDWVGDNFTFDFQINNTETLSQIFALPVSVISTAKVFGFYNSKLDKFKIEAFTPAIKAAGMNIKAGYVLIENPNDVITSKIDALIIGKKEVVNEVSVSMQTRNNEIVTNISFANNGIQKAKGTVDITTLFTKEHEEDPLRVTIDILPNKLFINNAAWNINKSQIEIQEGTYMVNNLLISNEKGDQEININGKYAVNDPRAILKAELKNINLEYIFQTLAIEALRFGGEATGSFFVSNIEKKPYVNTRLDVTNFKFNGTELGTLNLFSELDDETNKVVLDGKIVSKENKRTQIGGFLDPLNQRLSIDFDADSVDVSFLNKYASSLFNNIKGRGTGKIHLFGDFSNVTVEGKAFLKDASVGINFLNTTYSFTDTIYLKEDLIYFNDVAFTDQYQNKANISGKVAHDYFRDFMYYVDLSAENFMLYNATEKQNAIFYGTVFGTGKGSISGSEKSVDIDISMKTDTKTAVRMNFMQDVVNEYSFITYKNVAKKETTENSATGKTAIKTASGMDINMNFYIDATPDAIVELVMDPVGGDVIRGSGSGAMQFTWSTKKPPRLYGTYLINRGNYNFTFQRLVEKKFVIQDGSSVQFRGDPFEASLDVSAIYKIAANLNDLDRELVKNTGQTTIPVNCVLNLTGELKHPTVKLDILFPTADPEVQRQVKSLMNTEDMINRQVTYLLLLSKFYTPSDAIVTQKTSDFAAVASATLSNQLSSIINQIDDRWQLGANVRTSGAEFRSTEVELILSSQLLDDRLLINGNFGYRDNSLLDKKDALIGDIDLEYLLNNSGSWRIKAYNHYNEKLYYTNNKENSVQTQGVGLLYKKDFDRFRDLLGKKQNILPKDTLAPSAIDTLKKGTVFSNFIRFKK